MRETAEKISEKCPNIEAEVFGIRNDFFGESVTVSGLVTGKDVINQFKGKILPEILLMPEVMFRSGTEIMLDDVTIEELSKELGCKIKKIKTDGFSTVGEITGLSE